MSNIKLRIGLVLSSVPGYSETFFYTKINGLAKTGTEVILFARGETNPELNCKQVRPYPVFQHPVWRALCVVLILPVVFLRAPRAVVRFWKFEKEDGEITKDIFRSLYLNAHILTERVDWLHFGFATTALGRENVARAIGAKMAVSFRGYDINVYPLKNPGCYNQLWKRVDQVHSISTYLLEASYKLGLSRQTKYKIIYPAVNTIDLKQRKNFEFHTPIELLTVSRLHKIKGLDYAIKAVSLAYNKGIELQYSIVGDGEELNSLKNLCASLGIQNRVKFLGRKTHLDTLDLLPQADLYIQPSINEGFCNALLEAQGSGCLCIASRAGALPENIIEGETGFLVSPADEVQLCETVLQILSMSIEQRKEICFNAAKRVKEKFHIVDYIKNWERFYT